MIVRAPLSLLAVALSLGLSAIRAEENPGRGEGKLMGELRLTEDGKARCRIVLSDEPTEVEEEAARKFAFYVAQAGGGNVPIQRESEPASEGASVAIYVGKQKANTAVGLTPDNLPEETFAIKTRPGAVHLVGKDTSYNTNRALIPMLRSSATRWAVNYLAETCIGVRWLWPGALGTYVPRVQTISVPPLDITFTPTLELRAFRASLLLTKRPAGVPAELFAPADLHRERAETLEWMEDQQLGDRFRELRAHAFTDWWSKYSASQPDLFALAPEGMTQKGGKGAKLRLSNPAVIDTIAKEYIAAGRPAYWNISPNDGVGFDTSAETRAWDLPKDQSPLDIWKGSANLTARYVTFWNRVYERLSSLNPDVELVTLAYGAYRNPPLPESELKAKLVITVVPSYATDIWSGWAVTKPKMILRPNWWHSGSNAPYLPITIEGEYIQFAAKNGMIGFAMDSIKGFWGVQGLRYYVTARLLQDPSRSISGIVDEFTSGFGKAQNEVREYFDYWEHYSTEVAYPLAAGGAVSVNRSGLYEKAVAAHGFPLHPILGSTPALPYIYPDEILAGGREILDRALAKVKEDPDPSFAERVRFLQKGLDETEALRNVLTAHAEFEKDKTPEKHAAYLKSTEVLLALRRKLTREGVLWGDLSYGSEIRFGLPTLPGSTKAKAAESMEGM